MKAEKTRALASALPAAIKTLFGCQSIERTVDRRGFLRCLETHQLFSSSKEQTAMVLRYYTSREDVDMSKVMVLRHVSGGEESAYLAPLPTANLSSLGLHLTQVAALLIRSKTRAGFHSPEGSRVQT
jgi:hypothetical protein